MALLEAAQSVTVVLAVVLLAGVLATARYEREEQRAEARAAQLRCERAIREELARLLLEATSAGGYGASTYATLGRTRPC